MEVKYPKKTKTIKITNSTEGENQSLNVDNELKKMKYQIDELETSSLAINKENYGTQISELSSQVDQNTSNLSSVSGRLTTAEQSISSNASSIASLSSNKQNKLTAGANITISDQNVISATSSGSQDISALESQVEANTGNITNIQDDIEDIQDDIADLQENKQDTLLIDGVVRENSYNPVGSNAVYNALLTKQDVLTAGSNITIQNNVISASSGGGGSSCNCASDITELQNSVTDINAKLLVLQSKIESNSTQYNETITNEYDVYDRELEITGINSVYGANVLFATEPILTTTDENNETVSHQIKVSITCAITVSANVANGYKIDFYDGSIIVSTKNFDITAQELNTEKTVYYQYSYFTSGGYHNFYYKVSPSPTTSVDIVVYKQRIEIVAPNVTILNKIHTFDVQFNYYTNKYYLSDCSNGYAKIAEVDANNLSSTSDIVWTQTNIEAQNYKVYFIGATDNTTTTLGKKYAIITQKNDKVSVLDLNTETTIYTSGKGTNSVSQIFTRHNYSSLFRNTTNTSATNAKFFNLSDDGTISSTYSFSDENSNIKTEAIRNNLNYLSHANSWTGNFTIKKTGELYYFARNSSIANTSFKFVEDAKLYMKTSVSATNLSFYCFVKQFGKYYYFPGQYYSGAFNIGQTTLLGEFDDLFMGANGDFFTVKNNVLSYNTSISIPS